MTTRYEVERALEDSKLPPVSRHIILVLCTRMKKGSTLIPPEHSPSLTRLARGTGWHRRTIMRHLRELEAAGWVERRRPPPDLARARYMTTAYVVLYPQVGAGEPGPGAGNPGLEAENPGLGAGTGAGRGGEPRNQTESDQLSDHESDPEIEMVIAELNKRTGRTISPEWAAKARGLILARPGVRNRAAYLRRVLATDPNPARFLPSQEQEPHCERCGKTGHQKPDCTY